MSSREIRRLRRKFIAVSMLSIFLAMMFIGSTVNVLSYLISRVSVNNTLDALIEDAENVEERERTYGISLSDIFAPKYGRNAFFVLRFSKDGELLKLYTNSRDSDEG